MVSQIIEVLFPALLIYHCVQKLHLQLDKKYRFTAE